MEIVEPAPIRVKPNPHNEKYLQAKREKMGHLL
jgi:GTP cyclohydrolase II